MGITEEEFKEMSENQVYKMIARLMERVHDLEQMLQRLSNAGNDLSKVTLESVKDFEKRITTLEQQIREVPRH